MLHLEALQHRRLGRLLLAQGLDPVRRLGLGGHRLGFRLRRPPQRLQGGGQLRLVGIDLALRLQPAQVQHDGIQPADIGGQLLVASRLARLALQALDLRIELPQHVVEARQIRLRRSQPQLRLVAAAVQPGDAGGILQDAAALVGLGVDDLADLALAHQRRGARAGGGVLEQDAHVARAHLLAVDAVGRARLALDAARDIERFLAVELGRGLAVGVVDEDRDLGRGAGGAGGGAGEDHVVHGGRAHARVRGLAHHPAQRLQQVGLAAPVRPDHAGQALLDQQLGRLHERFEADEAEPVDMHRTRGPRYDLRLGRRAQSGGSLSGTSLSGTRLNETRSRRARPRPCRSSRAARRCRGTTSPACRRRRSSACR